MIFMATILNNDPQVYLEAHPYVYVPLASVSTLLWVTGVFSIIYYRRSFVVRERMPLLTIWFLTQLYFFGLILSLHGAFKVFPSFATYLDFWVCGTGAVATCIFRAWRVIVRYSVAHQQYVTSTGEVIIEQPVCFDAQSRRYAEFWVANKKLLHSKTFTVFVCLLLMLLMGGGCLLVMVLSGQDMMAMDAGFNKAVDVAYVFLIFTLVFLIFACVILLRPVREAFHLKRELSITAIVALIATILFIGVAVVAPGYNIRKHFTFILCTVTSITIMINTCSFPLYYSRFDPTVYKRLLAGMQTSTDDCSPISDGYTDDSSCAVPVNPSCSGSDTVQTDGNSSSHPGLPLIAVLQDQVQREIFRAYLVTEFSVENLIFWDEIESFRKRFAPLCALSPQPNENSPAMSAISLRSPVPAPQTGSASAASGSASLGRSLAQVLVSSSLTSDSSPEVKAMQPERKRSFGDRVKTQDIPRRPSNDSNASTPSIRPQEAAIIIKPEGERKVQLQTAHSHHGSGEQQKTLNVYTNNPGLDTLRQQCQEEAIRIYTTFIRRDAAFQVNLSHTLVSRIVQDLFGPRAPTSSEGPKSMPGPASHLANANAQKPATPPIKVKPDSPARPFIQPNIFDRAQRSVYVLMEENSLDRFFRSPEYKRWRRQMKAKEEKERKQAAPTTTTNVPVSAMA